MANLLSAIGWILLLAALLVAALLGIRWLRRLRVRRGAVGEPARFRTDGRHPRAIWVDDLSGGWRLVRLPRGVAAADVTAAGFATLKIVHVEVRSHDHAYPQGPGVADSAGRPPAAGDSAWDRLRDWWGGAR